MTDPHAALKTFLQQNNTQTLQNAAKNLSSASLLHLQKALTESNTLFENSNADRFFKAYTAISHFFSLKTSCKFEDTITLQADKNIPLQDPLMALSPWRKGPFNILGTHIDTEWQSQLKWNQLLPHLPDLKHKKILDIGCNSGYYMYRMAPFHPKWVLGLDPSILFYFQFHTLQGFAKHPKLNFAPLKIQELYGQKNEFDIIFCMGVLYHQRNPSELLGALKALLSKEGTLILETLIIPGDDPHCLCPADRYAAMGNVHFIPTLHTLQNWLKKAGFHSQNVAYTAHTTPEEQRATPWSGTPFSLINALDPTNPQKTIEGYPAPLRTTIIAQSYNS